MRNKQEIIKKIRDAQKKFADEQKRVKTMYIIFYYDDHWNEYGYLDKKGNCHEDWSKHAYKTKLAALRDLNGKYSFIKETMAEYGVTTCKVQT